MLFFVLGQRGDVLDDVMPLTGGDLGRDGGRHVGGIDVVDLGGDAVGLTPLGHELVEPLVMARHEVAPEKDAEAGAGNVGRRRRLPQRSGARPGPEEGRRRGERERRAGTFEDRSPIGPSGQKGSQPIVSHHVAPLRLWASRRGSCRAMPPGQRIEPSPIQRVKRARSGPARVAGDRCWVMERSRKAPRPVHWTRGWVEETGWREEVRTD